MQCISFKIDKKKNRSKRKKINPRLSKSQLIKNKIQSKEIKKLLKRLNKSQVNKIV